MFIEVTTTDNDLKRKINPQWIIQYFPDEGDRSLTQIQLSDNNYIEVRHTFEQIGSMIALCKTTDGNDGPPPAPPQGRIL